MAPNCLVLDRQRHGGRRITNDNTLTLTGTAEANATVKVFDGATLLGSVVANGSGAWTYTTAALANGAHSLDRDGDRCGRQYRCGFGGAERHRSTRRRRMRPSSRATRLSMANEVMLTGTAEANSKVTVFDGGTLLGTATTDSSGAWSYTTSPLSDGPHAFTATATDAAGNTSLVSQVYDPIVGGTVIEANGTISLTQVGNKYYLDESTGAVPPVAEVWRRRLCGRSIWRLGADWRGEDGDRL